MSKEEILELISDNRTKDALKLLKELLKENDLKAEVILLSRMYESLNQKTRLGIIDDREKTKEENQINFAIVSLLNTVNTFEVDLKNEEINIIEKNKQSNVEAIQKNDDLDNPKSGRINTISKALVVVAFIGVFSGLIFYFFKYDSSIECKYAMTLRNDLQRVETSSLFFVTDHYKTIDGFIVKFFKEKGDSIKDINLMVILEFPIKGNDSLWYLVENLYKYIEPTFHMEYKKGGETYFSLTYESFYNLSNGYHLRYVSKPIKEDVLFQIINQEVSDLTFFNKYMNLTPFSTTSLHFKGGQIKKNMKKINKYLECLSKEI